MSTLLVYITNPIASTKFHTIEDSMPGTYVYVDGFNLYYGALKRTPYKWLDLAQLCRIMLPSDAITTIQYFTARVSARAHNPSAPLDQQVYFRALAPGIAPTVVHTGERCFRGV